MDTGVVEPITELHAAMTTRLAGWLAIAAVWTATIASQVTFCSIFQALQNKQTFAPLTFQNFQIFAHDLGDFCRFFQNVVEISLKSQIFR